MATLTVGQGQQYSTIKAAVAASRDGDVVQVQAGTYTNEFIEINTKITLQGVGGMVKMVGTTDVSNGKGILVTNTDVTVDHFEFSGATGGSNNAAGIRYQAGNLVVTNSYFHDNQNGILANPSSTGTITIKNSEFDHNGYGDGYTHNIYVNDVAKLTIQDSFFHDAVYGHEIKSRASITEITNTRIYDNNGDASYSVDLPNGGKAILANNIIQQGPNSANPNIVAFGAEGSLHSGSSLTMTNNTIINEMAGRGSMVMNPGGAPVSMDGTQVWGVNQLTSGSGITATNTTTLSSKPGLDSSHPWDGSSAPLPPEPTPEPTPVPGTGGNDALSAAAGGDSYIRGGEGADTITGNLDHFNNVNGNQGADSIIGRSSVGDWLLGGQGDDVVNAGQSSGHNIINGNIGVDTVIGGSGADILRGGQGDDQITGGAGNDWIAGDLGGANVATGGAGADTFYAVNNGGVTHVTDFSGAQGDRVDLDPGVTYQLSQQGADLHVVLTNGQGGELVLQNVTQANFQTSWIV
ncbi:calcium-binding protein [Phenylobacterium sp. LjRoot219]|uniref:calcium-binding protein n=1 Tax=Phenylobacterium sp. LjRoot219 TaxID=3342283 RepID=UPI003ECFF863